MIILIPAYEPDQQLPALIRSIREAEPWATVVVVDDGSGPAYRDMFDGVKALGCHVIGYAQTAARASRSRQASASLGIIFPAGAWSVPTATGSTPSWTSSA